MKKTEGFAADSETAEALAKILEVQEGHHVTGEDCFPKKLKS